MAFDPAPYMMKIPRNVKDPKTGQWIKKYDDYLEVKWRVVWFRSLFPHGRITTEEVLVDLDREITVTVDKQTKKGRGYARFRAVVEDGQGGVSTGYGTENGAEFTDFVERSETRALGRALAGLGIGTAFVGMDFSEGAHVADSPINPPASPAPASAPKNGHPRSPSTAERAKPTAEEITVLNKELRAMYHDEAVSRINHVMGYHEKYGAAYQPSVFQLKQEMTGDQYALLMAMLAPDEPEGPPDEEPPDEPPGEIPDEPPPEPPDEPPAEPEPSPAQKAAAREDAKFRQALMALATKVEAAEGVHGERGAKDQTIKTLAHYGPPRMFSAEQRESMTKLLEQRLAKATATA